MADVFFRATADALSNITYAYDFVHPLTVSLQYVRNKVNSLIESNPDISNEEIRAVIDPSKAVHTSNYKGAFVGTQWEDQEERIAWLLLNNLFAIHEGWAQRLYEENFNGFGYTDRFIKNLEMKELTRKFSSYFIVAGKTSTVMTNAFFYRYKDKTGLNFSKLDNYMLCYRFFKEARNCFMHGNFVASVRLISAYNEYFPKATLADLDVSEVPIIIPPVLGQPVHLSLRGVIGFSQILRRIIIISDVNLLRTKAAEKEFLERIPTNRRDLFLNGNEQRAKNQISACVRNAGFLKAQWSIEFQKFLIANRVFLI